MTGLTRRFWAALMAPATNDAAGWWWMSCGINTAITTLASRTITPASPHGASPDSREDIRDPECLPWRAAQCGQPAVPYFRYGQPLCLASGDGQPDQ